MAKVPINCAPTDLAHGPEIEDIPIYSEGTPRDVSDKVMGQNRAAAFIYKEKHAGLKGCIEEYNQ